MRELSDANAFASVRPPLTGKTKYLMIKLTISVNYFFTQFVVNFYDRCRFHAWWFHGYNNAFAHATHRGEYGRRSVGLGGNIGKSLRSMEIGAKPSSRYEVSQCKTDLQGDSGGRGSGLG